MPNLRAQSLALAAGHTTSVALTEATLLRIQASQQRLNAYLHVDDAGARRAAGESDARRAQGRSLGPLDGIAFAVKDNIDAAGLPTTAGMATRRGRIASTDAFVVQQRACMGDSGDDRDEHNRPDHHFDQSDKKLAEDGEVFASRNKPCAFRVQRAVCNAKYDPDKNVLVETRFARFGRGHKLFESDHIAKARYCAA